MERTALHQLDTWKTSRNRKPLIIRGARQTGKTWLSQEFGKTRYTSVARIDLMNNERARHFFDGDLDVHRIVRNISLETGVRVTQDTLIILDEIQECPRALIALKYFCEDAPEYHVISTGSYMGITRHEGDSYPVGKVNTLTLHPLDFSEYLRAIGQDMMADMLADRDGIRDLDASFRDKLTAWLKEYMVVGGMPAAVADFADHHDFSEVRRLQRDILDDYDSDFSKHAPLRMLERIRMVWSSLPSQLAKENRKFIYGALRDGARARDFEESIQWLCDYGAAIRVPAVSAIRTPLSSYAEQTAFKLFAVDCGLLGALSGLNPKTILDGDALFTEFKGAFTEQYVCQQLVAQDLKPYYWSAPRGRSEVDFAVDHPDTALPIEVKAEENLHAKSLRTAVDHFALRKAVRTSLAGYRDEGWLLNLPLWSINSLRGLDITANN
ncbi:ATP-binding protein [Bifidobacterium sp. SO1]|uniref:ATP-binding protein n=1 Tax=Bifidobacterium sp. SO1 TaxID=2809029 RepID=UPI001BDDA3AE|nr:ATP-binding protein [Bifidobacterium sp. SO1]MBT1162667.1 ATP-binding protein [Bifidobacterium sp. SO1]